MKKVLLLGDSICMGYADYVSELLKEKCVVYHDKNDNGRFSSYTLWHVNQFFKKYGAFDVVHWNNGYWDMNVEGPMTDPIHPVDEYVHFLKRIIGEIRRNGAQIIFATTTPIVKSGSALDNTGTGEVISYNNDWVIAYNNAAKKLMSEQQISVNDLYALMFKGNNYYKCQDMLHLTDEGYRICASQVAKLILEKL